MSIGAGVFQLGSASFRFLSVLKRDESIETLGRLERILSRIINSRVISASGHPIGRNLQVVVAVNDGMAI